MNWIDAACALPGRWLSALIGVAARTRAIPGWQPRLVRWFCRRYAIDFSQVEGGPEDFPTLQDLFVRRLIPGARPISGSPVVCPVDGTLVSAGALTPRTPRLEQVKGMTYTLEKLAGPAADLGGFSPGGYFNWYLAPPDYHRIHSPFTGEIVEAAHTPGALWPVNPWFMFHWRGLLVRNERIAVRMRSPQGELLLVMVGATNVGAITLEFTDALVGNRPGRWSPGSWRPPEGLFLEKGEPLGCFRMGSSAVLVADSRLWRAKAAFYPAAGKKCRVGESLFD